MRRTKFTGRIYRTVAGIIGCGILMCAGCRDDRADLISGDEGVELPEIVPSNVVYVQFQRECVAAYTGETGISRVVDKWGDVKLKRVFPPAGKFEERRKAFGLDLWYKVELPEETDAREVVDFYSGQEGVVYVEKEVPVAIPVPLALPYGEESRAMAVDLPFNDPGLSKQWHYDRMGVVETSENAHIGLFKGWKVTGGNRKVIVAVLDVGVDYLHDDLKDNMWVNEAELNGVPGKDNDNNGYAGDIYGYNFAAGTGNVDRADHGTHVAGTIAAVNNNGIGVCGIAGGTGQDDGVRIMACQIGTTFGGVTSNWEALANAFAYAADNGAVICQCSWTFPYGNSLLKSGIEYFIEHAGSGEDSPMKGGIVIVAAGNDGRHMMAYPAGYESCISVAAVSNTGQKADYSNYDESVDISAPGGLRAPTELGVYSTLANNKYGYMNGTSMACPHVSGIAALIISAHANEDFTAEQLKNILLESVVSIEDSDPEYAALMGKGVARVDRALWNDDGVAPEAVNDLTLTQKDNKFFLTWSNASDPNDGSPRFYQVYSGEIPLTETNLEGAEMQQIDVRDKKAGDRVEMEIPVPEDRLTVSYYAVTGEDTWGNVSALSNVLTVRWEDLIPEEEPEPTPGEKKFGVYPNPTKGILNITWGDACGMKSVNVYDLMARRVFTKILNSSDIAGEEAVDISRLPAGRYVLKFSSDEGVRTTNVVKI